ncbi:unnamed protein product [Auanema sp. JU1783]|nr:unnamed protein product [Auanema sp. JU1783]
MRTFLILLSVFFMAVALQGPDDHDFERLNENILNILHAPPLAPLPEMTSIRNVGPPGFAPPHDVMLKIRENYLKRKRIHGLSRRKTFEDDFAMKHSKTRL